MPYIDQDRRRHLEKGGEPQTPADLDYLFSRIIDRYHVDHGVTFTVIAEVLAALESTKLEYYRRIAAPYEQKKAAQNGDVFSAPTIQGVFKRDAIPQHSTKLADANKAAEEAAKAADEAAGVTPEPEPARIIPQESSRTVEQDGVAGVEGGGFTPGDPTGNLSGNPNITVGEQEGKETDDGIATDRPNSNPNST